jgi:hypothetical protein
LRSEDVISRPPGFFDVGAWDLSRFDDPVGSVTVRGETHLDVLRALHEACAFLRRSTCRSTQHACVGLQRAE